MDSVGLGCRPQTSSGTLERVRGVSSSILQALQQGPLAPGFPASLPPLPPDANTFQGACVVTPALFSPILLGSSSGSFLEQYPLAVCLEPLILLGSVCSGQLGWLPTPQNAVFLKQTLV